jgi:hypothetical protein
MTPIAWAIPVVACWAGHVVWSRLPSEDHVDSPLEELFASVLLGIWLCGFAGLALAE